MAPTVQVSSINTNADIDSRYSDLLKPIRDLTKNWEVNIAAYLEEFLSELDGIAISFNNGASSLNFARAALLIQGSTTVYCKKVEYLCILCQEMRHVINDERRRKKSGSDVLKEKDLAYHCVSDEFVSLDNIKEHKSLELTDEGDIDSFRRISILPLTPIVLIPLEEREKGNTMLFNVKGEVFGNKQDYHLNISHIDSSGALLLPCSDVTSEFIREDARDCMDCASAVLPTFCSEVVVHDLINEEMRDCFMPTVGTELEAVDDCNEYSPPSPVASEESACCNNEEEVEHTKRRRSSRLACKKQDKIEKQRDLWNSRDFNETLLKPLKKRKTKKLAVPLKYKVTKRKSSNLLKGKVSGNPTSSSEEFCSRAFYSHSSKFPTNNLKIPEISLFENVFWEQSKKETESLKMCQRPGSNIDENQHEDEGEDVLNCNDTFTADSDDDINNDPLSEISDVNPEESPCGQATYQEQIPVVSSYEELARKNTELYLEGLAQYCLTTDLSKKVSEWEDKIKPILENESKREIFDIHVYENRLMDVFSDNNRKQSLPFSHTCKEKAKWEVCRYFLASLQLVNNYNLNISETKECESNEDFELTLLSRKKQFDDMYDTTE